MRIAEVWATDLSEVEFGASHWLEGDDTYHNLSSRRASRGHRNVVCLLHSSAHLSARRDGVDYEFFPIETNSEGPTSQAMLAFLQAYRPEAVLLHSSNHVQTTLCLNSPVPGARYILDSNSAAISNRVLDAVAVQHDLVAGCLFKAATVRDSFCQQTGFPFEKTRVIPSGIDVKHFSPRPGPVEIDCIWVGYLRANNMRKKNLALLMKVFTGFEASCWIVGSGSKAKAWQRSAPPNIFFAGPIDHIALPALLNRSSIFVFPSIFDPAPRAVSEALACGLPVIGLRDCVGTEDQIVDGVNGFRVDTVEAMRDGIRQLLSDPVLRERMGRESQRIAEAHFDIEIVDQALQEYLDGLASYAKAQYH